MRVYVKTTGILGGDIIKSRRLKLFCILSNLHIYNQIGLYIDESVSTS